MRTSPSKLTVNPFSELWVCAQCAFKCVHICVCEWVMNGDSQSTASVLQLQSSTTALVQVEENMTKWKCFLLASMKTRVKNIISMNTEVNCIADKICMTLSRQFAHSVLPLPLPLHSLLPPPPRPPVPSFLPLTKQMEVSVDFHLTHARAELPGSFAFSGVRSCLFGSQRFLCWPSCAVGLHGEVKGRWAVTGAEALRCVSISATSEHTFSPWSFLLKSI